MTMKRRIFISNTVIVLFSLLILLGLGGVIVGLFKNEFMNIIEQKSQIAAHNYEVQGILQSAGDYNGDWNALSDALAAYDYELYVSDSNQNELYSNIRHSEWECISELEKSSFDSEQVVLYSMENVTIAKEKILKGEESTYIYAAYYPKEASILGMDRGIFDMFIIVFVVAGVLAILGLLLCSQIFTNMLIRKVLVPVEELRLAAKRIEEGNFDENIEYNKDDEFLEVCTAFNNMQQHLKEGVEQSAAYEKARTDMISGISHDLRTPLTSVKGYIKGLKDGIANTPEKQEQYLDTAYRKACDMDILLQKLFYFSKLETGNMPFFKQRIDFTTWIASYTENRRGEWEQQNLQVALETDHHEHPVYIDSEQMKRVFDNVIDNSIKYSDRDNLHVWIKVSGHDGKVLIQIKDNGKGTDSDKLGHLFELFYRGDESRNSKKEGSGLGLYICRHIVEQHGGTINAANDNGFTISIELSEK
ncbi:HAMP domain-containing sensor histidine kinase [Parasporobacterium paucivorans]|uniref:histidine kinase n=1 Tax=Parasporobacterium paucivorans DSM 15970 TaxID=1122934 RepID=A0A1M6IZK4_9FIRM|nr:HAMP domain-containing sensor histidine kinase [Parasporobacterium paucivorans]SHJ39782.1 Signal transduction histidine kinase [Parasporobacterium paucivorans DSM 15970]